MTKKSLAQGIDNFKKIMDLNAYYVDKSLFVKDIIDVNDQIILITRPRRFGKTLNMSMLKYFFEKKECRRYTMEEVDTAYLFEGLKYGIVVRFIGMNRGSTQLFILHLKMLSKITGNTHIKT